MKLTKYEHNHKDCDKTGRTYYVNPIERIVFIVFINLAILTLPFGLLLIDKPNNIQFAIAAFGFIVVFSFILEYNPIMIINYLDYLAFNLLSKKSVYKKFIQELRDYNNVIEFERKLNILNLRTSCVNSKKVLFSLKRKNCKKGIIHMNKIIFVLNNNKKMVIKYSIKDFKNLNEFLKFLRNKINENE